MLVDEVLIIVSSGRGGDGRVSFGRRLRSGPDGGNGGNGGNVYALSVENITALLPFSKKKKWQAEDGVSGGRNQKTGAKGTDLNLYFPVGSTLIDQDSKEIFEINNKNQKILLCRGGIGGKGNYELRSSTNTTPKKAHPGLPGTTRVLKVVLRLIADFGLIGLPNAGKSSLLNELTGTRVKVADYPFTTLEPNLGSLNKKIIADVPGLIEGASGGKGLGIKFLKHVEKVPVLLHCIAADSSDVRSDYKTVMAELERFNSDLAKKEQIIILTKSDLVDEKEIKRKVSLLKKIHSKVFITSVYDFESIEKLRKIIVP